jgi:hypothetical protein
MAKKNGREASNDRLRTWLAAQTHEHLVELLWSHAGADPALRQRLELEAAAQRVGGLDTAPFLAALDRAIVVDFVEDHEVATWAHHVDDVLRSVGDLLDQGHARAVVDLMEHAQRLMHDAYERVDDDGFHLDGLLFDIEALHLQACRSSGLDAEALATRLLELEIGSESGFAGAVDRVPKCSASGGSRRTGVWPRRSGPRCRHDALARPRRTTRGGTAWPASWRRWPHAPAISRSASGWRAGTFRVPTGLWPSPSCTRRPDARMRPSPGPSGA